MFGVSLQSNNTNRAYEWCIFLGPEMVFRETGDMHGRIAKSSTGNQLFPNLSGPFFSLGNGIKGADFVLVLTEGLAKSHTLLLGVSGTSMQL